MFITLEGIEGSGKTTLLHNLADALKGMHRDVVLTCEPGGCSLGKTLRQLLLNPSSRLTSETELFLFLADRAQHVAEVIRPALKKGVIVLCDRYADSTIVYQGYGRGLAPETLYRLNNLAVDGLWPDKTLVLDMDPATALTRARNRNVQEGIAGKEGRFEAEDLIFHSRIREGFRQWAKRNPGRMVLLNAADTPEGLLAQALGALSSSQNVSCSLIKEKKE